ncbi:MAG: hypothetical protein WBA67_05935 [Jannaschia sp.]
MNICFDGLKSGQVCLGSALSSLHGAEYGATHAGIAILAIIALAVGVFVFKSPA